MEVHRVPFNSKRKRKPSVLNSADMGSPLVSSQSLKSPVLTQCFKLEREIKKSLQLGKKHFSHLDKYVEFILTVTSIHVFV